MWDRVKWIVTKVGMAITHCFFKLINYNLLCMQYDGIFKGKLLYIYLLKLTLTNNEKSLKIFSKQFIIESIETPKVSPSTPPISDVRL